MLPSERTCVAGPSMNNELDRMTKEVTVGQSAVQSWHLPSTVWSVVLYVCPVSSMDPNNVSITHSEERANLKYTRAIPYLQFK
jgi:hypothetical protein